MFFKLYDIHEHDNFEGIRVQDTDARPTYINSQAMYNDLLEAFLHCTKWEIDNWDTVKSLIVLDGGYEKANRTSVIFNRTDF
jgi:hypothetical protein